MARFKDLITKGIAGAAPVTIATKGWILNLIVSGEIIIPDGVKWNDAHCTWDTTKMQWDYGRSHACRGIEQVLRRVGGGGEFQLFVPYPLEDKRTKKKRYIKLTCSVESFKFEKRKEVKENIKINTKDVDLIIKESFMKLNIEM